VGFFFISEAVKEIHQGFNSIGKETTNQVQNNKNSSSNIQQDREEIKRTIYKSFGWHFMVKEVSDYTHCTYWEIMERPAIEVVGIVTLIHYKTMYNQ